MEKKIKTIMRDIKYNVGWIENGKPKELSEASLSTIESILEVHLIDDELSE
jgi:hypothetical protein